MSRAGEMARGNWKGLLPALGVDSKFLQNKHGPCPICGGADRFRWDDKNSGGGFICNQCGAGDGFDLASRVTGKSFREIADQIATILGQSNDYKAPVRDPQEERNRLLMLRLWNESEPILDGHNCVQRYLMNRCNTLWYSSFVRVHRERRLMVAKIVSHGDKAVNLHVTSLTDDGRKADVTPAKRVMAGKLPDGCAIRLSPAAPVMGVAEGIETAISSSLMFDMPVWACVNGTLLSKWIPPEVAEQITVFGDNDANYTGHAKAYHLANRLEVQFKRSVNVMIAPEVGTDWNDFHQDHREEVKPVLRVVK
jgi:putative DNA primase/helicase